MPSFQYIALDAQKRFQKGVEEASNALVVRRRLEDRGWQVTKITEVAEPIFEGTLSSGEAAVVAQRVAEVARLNLPLEAGLRAVAEEAPTRRLRAILTVLANNLERGESLTDALAQHQGRVPKHLLNLIQAGLETETLASVLERYVQSARLSAEIRRRVLLGLTYPAMLFFGGALLLVAFLVILMPQFDQIFQDFDTNLPKLTIAVVSVSRFLRSYGVWAVLTLGVFGVAATLGAMAYVRTRQGRAVLCWVPVYGPLLRLTALAEFASLLGQFLDARTEMPRALELAGLGSGDAEIAWAAEGLAHEVRQGVPLADAATMSSGIPHPMRQMLRWSTHPRKFAEALYSAAEMCRARASVQVIILGPFLEPVALFGVGITFGLLLIAILLPLFKLLNDLA